MLRIRASRERWALIFVGLLYLLTGILLIDQVSTNVDHWVYYAPLAVHGTHVPASYVLRSYYALLAIGGVLIAVVILIRGILPVMNWAYRGGVVLLVAGLFGTLLFNNYTGGGVSSIYFSKGALTNFNLTSGILLLLLNPVAMSSVLIAGIGLLSIVAGLIRALVKVRQQV